jgi:hypothetical protein
MATIKIDKALSPKQIEFTQSKARFRLWRAGRRSGKTEALVYDWGKYAISNKSTINWFVAQDTATVKELTIPLFERLFPREVIKDFSKSDKCFTLFNGSKCYFKSANSADSLRGRKVHNLACEEAAFWHNGADIYHNILRPQLSDTLGRCMIVSSPPNKKAPTGAEWFRRLEQTYQEEVNKGNTDYGVFYSNIWNNPFIIDKERNDLERMTDPDTWQIEYMGEYCDKVGQVYWEFDPLKDKRVTDERILYRVRGLDFGIADNTACSWVGLLDDNRVYVYDEYSANNLDVPSHARVILQKTLQPVAYTILDSACWARDPSLTSVAKRFAAESIPCNQATKDLDGSVSDLKKMFAAGKIIIDPKCTTLLSAIESWQHGQHEPDILAATRYAIDGLIRSGKLMPPVRTDSAPTWKSLGDRMKERREDSERAARLLSGNQGMRRFTII